MIRLLYLLAILFPAFATAQTAIDWQRCYGGSGYEGVSDMLNTSDGGYLMVSASTSEDGMVNGNHGWADVWVVKLDLYGLIEWKRCYGGSGEEFPWDVIETSDGGYIITANVSSFSGNENDGDVSGCYIDESGGLGNSWVFKIDSFGNLQWQRCIGGSGRDRLYSIVEGVDGGALLCGVTNSSDGDVFGYHGETPNPNNSSSADDIWIVKLDDLGNIVWQRCLGGSRSDYSSVVSLSNDGGYMILGHTESNDGDVLGYHDGLDSLYYNVGWDYFYWNDAWIVKLDATGNLLWQRCIGGSSGDWVETILPVQDGYVLAGGTNSNDGDVVGYHVGTTSYSPDAWVIELDENGDLLWQGCYGGAQYDWFGNAIATEDGYLFSGLTSSVNGDVGGYHPGMWSNGERTEDAWMMKTDFYGNVLWQNCVGGSGDEYMQRIEPSESGYFFVGYTNSLDGDIQGYHAPPDSVDGQYIHDIWVGNVDLSGGLMNSQCLGGSSDEYNQGFLNVEEGYILYGSTISGDGDVTGFYGGSDIWLVQLSNVVGVEETTQAKMALFPNPAYNRITVITEQDFSNDSYIVYDAQGRAVLQGVLTSRKSEIIVEGLSPGIYTLRTVGAGVGSVKFMKE